MEEAEEVFCSVSTPHTSTMAGCGAFFLVFNLLQQDGGDKGNGDSGYTFKFNNHSLTAFNATDDSCDSIKNTTSNQNVLAFFADYSHWKPRNGASGKAERFGAKKEAKKHLIIIHSLAQRTNQETSTPYQTTPYMGCLNQEVAEADDFLTVLVSRDTA